MLINILIISTILLSGHRVSGQTSEVPEYFTEASKQFNIDVSLLYAICSQESRCKAKAINHNDAKEDRRKLGIKESSIGMFQIKMATARGLGFEGSRQELFDPRINTHYAAKLLRHLYDRYGQDTIKVISAYNAGRVTKHNKKYVDQVSRHYLAYKIDRRL